jgi:ubiquinone/menaquinone biosynthesis C-methylase UbiE
MSNANEIETQDRVAEEYEEVRYKRPWSRRYHTWLFEHMIRMLKPYGKILDAGCGVGFLGECLASENLWGIDISYKMVERAKYRMERVSVGDVENLPYEDNSFDCIFARSLVHHLPHPQVGVRELFRVLKVGGMIIFLDTRSQNPLSGIFRNRLKEGEHFSDIHQNLQEPDYLEMIDRFARIVKTEYMGYLGYTLMGFPDINNVYRFFPGKFLLTPLLMTVERVWAKVPGFNRLGLGIITLARKEQ